MSDDSAPAFDPQGTGIAAGAIYLPQYRLATDELAEAWGTSHAAGIDRKAVPGADEDALTMAVAAGERALEAWSGETDSVRTVVTATTTPPMAEGEYAPRLVRALGLPDDVATLTATGSTAAGVEALASALGAETPALVAVADCPRGDPADSDHATGAGAAAFLLADDASVRVSEPGWHVDERPGIRSREQGSTRTDSLGITAYERSAIRTGVTEAARSTDVDPEAVAAAAIHQPDGKTPYRAAGDLPIEPAVVSAGTVVDRIGDAGAATVPIALLAALDGDSNGEPTCGDKPTLAVGFGGGTAVAVGFEGGLDAAGIGDLAGGADISYTDHLRKRGEIVDGDVAGGGAHVSLPNWQRSLDQRYRLVAGRCPECGDVTFPPEGACQHCHERVKFDRFEAPREGTVVARTTIGRCGAPPEFADQQQRDGAYGVAIVDVGDGAERVRLPAQLTDVDPGDVAVGDAVGATIRRIYEQEGVPRYGVKFVPTD